jgi:hypothetical protein
VSFATQRLREAIEFRDNRAPAYAVIVALQTAIEVLIDEAIEANGHLGPFPRSDKPHRDRIEAAHVLSLCGQLDEEVPDLVRELARWSGLSRYGEVEPHPTAINGFIARVEAVVAQGPTDQLAA